jgi:hypothetical protein
MAKDVVPKSMALARYVLALERGAHACTRAEDRLVYGTLLADAAGILAVAVAEVTLGNLDARLAAHDRLRGQVWLQDSRAAAEASAAWAQCQGAASGDAAI